MVGLTAVSVSVSPYMERVREKRLRSASLALVSTAREEDLRQKDVSKSPNVTVRQYLFLPVSGATEKREVAVVPGRSSSR